MKKNIATLITMLVFGMIAGGAVVYHHVVPSQEEYQVIKNMASVAADAEAFKHREGVYPPWFYRVTISEQDLINPFTSEPTNVTPIGASKPGEIQFRGQPGGRNYFVFGIGRRGQVLPITFTNPEQQKELASN
jgi:hypothetical protein